MKISNIVSVPAYNVARAVIDGSSYKKNTSEELASSLLQNGWEETSHVGVRTPTPEELEVVKAYLTQERGRMEQLEGSELAYSLTLSHDVDNAHKAVKTKVTNSMLLAEFVQTYFNGAKLKSLAKVKLTVFGHHRTHMVLVANAARANNGKNRLEPKTLEHLYESEEAWKDACIRENAQRERAATGLNTLDVLRQAKSLRDSGFTESKHRKDLGNKKVGLIQQAWRFLRLDTAHPDLSLYQKALLPEGNENRIPYKSLGKEELQKFLVTNEKGEMATASAVEAYVMAPLKKGTKPLTGAELKTIRESAPCALLKALLSEIAVGDRETIKAMNSNSTLFNSIEVPEGVLSLSEAIAVLEAGIESLRAKQAALK